MERVLREGGEQWARRSRLRLTGGDMKWFMEKAAVGFGVETEDVKREQIQLSRGILCCALLHWGAGGRVGMCFRCQVTHDKPIG